MTPTLSEADKMFVNCWNASSGRADVCHSMGMTLSQVQKKAKVLRNRGVKLKSFARNFTADCDPHGKRGA